MGKEKKEHHMLRSHWEHSDFTEKRSPRWSRKGRAVETSVIRTRSRSRSSLGSTAVFWKMKTCKWKLKVKWKWDENEMKWNEHEMKWNEVKHWKWSTLCRLVFQNEILWKFPVWSTLQTLDYPVVGPVWRLIFHASHTNVRQKFDMHVCLYYIYMLCIGIVACLYIYLQNALLLCDISSMWKHAWIPHLYG